MSARLSAILVLALALALAWGYYQGRPPPPQPVHVEQGITTVQLQVQSSRESFRITESIFLRVSLSNPGTTPVEIPDLRQPSSGQPAYTLWGPGWPEGHTFSLSGPAGPASAVAPEPAAMATLSLGPGQTVETTLPLHTFVKLTRPGRYRFTAQLQWKGRSVRSAPVEFTVEEPVREELSLGLDVPTLPSAGVWVLSLEPNGGSPRLNETYFVESRPDLGETDKHLERPLLTPGSQASDPLTPWANHDRTEQLYTWHAWREGTDLVASVPLSPVSRVTLEAAPSAMVRPALMSQAEQLHLFAVSQDGRQLIHAHFMPPKEPGASPQGTRLEDVVLPGVIQMARAALAPPRAGGAPHVLAVTQEEQLTLHLLRVAGKTAQKRFSPVSLPGAQALLRSEPDVWIDNKGEAWVALLVGTEPEQNGFALVEARFTPDGTLSKEPRRTPLGQLPARAVAATVRYSVSPRREGESEWAVLLETGEVLHSLSDGKPRRTSSPPSLPLELVPLAQSTYLLTLHHEEGPQLEALHP